MSDRRPLTVAQLRAALATMPDDLEVWCEGCDCTRGVLSVAVATDRDYQWGMPPGEGPFALLSTRIHEDEDDEETT